MQDGAMNSLNRNGVGEGVSIRKFMDIRYEGQVQEVIVPVRSRTRRLTPVNLSTAIKDFHELHEELYAFKRVGYPTELVSVRIELVATEGRLSMPSLPFGTEDPSPARIGARDAYFPEHGMISAAIYEGALLNAGNVISGPAVIHEADTTIVVGVGHEAMLDQSDTYVIEIGA